MSLSSINDFKGPTATRSQPETVEEMEEALWSRFRDDSYLESEDVKSLKSIHELFIICLSYAVDESGNQLKNKDKQHRLASLANVIDSKFQKIILENQELKNTVKVMNDKMNAQLSSTKEALSNVIKKHPYIINLKNPLGLIKMYNPRFGTAVAVLIGAIFLTFYSKYQKI